MLRALKRRRKPPVRTPYGFSMAGLDGVDTGTFEPAETLLVKQHLTDCELLVNVGAHAGYYCLLALQAGKRVIAVEPNSENVHYLLKNIAENGWASLAEVHPVAAGSETSVSMMWGSNTSASMLRGWAQNRADGGSLVPVMALDRILGDALNGRRAIVIVDAEGSEHLVLRGATRALDSTPSPLWMVEITDRQHRPKGEIVNPYLEETFSYLLDRGYRCQVVGGRAEPITMDRVRAAVNGDRLPGHNFMFSKP